MPIVSTCSGGIPSVITDGRDGVLVEPGNALELAATIRRLRENPVLAQSLGARAAERAKREFHWPVLFAAHEQAIARLLKLD
jgi:glycosyltransferase involved in cell wall biosynthesis